MGDISHIVSNNEGKRIDVYVSEVFSITRTRAKYLIEEGYITVNGNITKPSLKVKKGMLINAEIPKDEPLSLEPQNIPLDIIYEDEYFLAVNKPYNMVVHPSFGHREKTLANAVLGYLNISNSENSNVYRAGIVHRLDKDTTGVILIAKDGRTQELLSKIFKKREILKRYRSVVEGIIEDNSITIEGNIGRHPVERKKMAVLKTGGREAITVVKVLERLKGYTYVEVYPKTGRTHQIRVHLSFKGHPVVGDKVYGKRAKNLTQRILLHAYELEFTHPVKNIPVKICAPVPEDILSFVESHKN